MKKTVFIHDTVFIKKGDKYYAKDGLDNEVFIEYSQNFGDITVMARYEEYNENNSVYIKDENEIKNVIFLCEDSFYKVIKNIKNKIKDYDFCILRVHSFISTVAFLYLKKFRIPYLVESVSCAWDCLWYHSLKGKIIAPVLFLLTRLIVYNSKYVLYVSDFLLKRYKHNKYAMKIICSDVRLINYDYNQFLNYYDSNKIYNLCTIANSDVKYKGHEYVIKAIADLKKESILFNYYLIGGGSGRRLKKLAQKYNVEDRIFFVGPIPHSKIFDYLKENIGIYIQPSNAESHGRVILEAESLGIPVIGSSTGGIPEIVNNKYIFKRKKYKDLKNKMKCIINENEVLNQSNWSFENSKKFNKKVLSDKRCSFYKNIFNDLYK